MISCIRFDILRPVVVISFLALATFSGSIHAENAITKIYFFKECPTTGPSVFAEATPSKGEPTFLAVPAAAITAIVTPLVNAVVDKGIEAIKNAAKDQDFPLPSPTPEINDFYQVGIAGDTQINPEIGCIVLARGQFDSTPTPKFEQLKKDKGIPLLSRIDAKFRVADINDPTKATVIKKDSLEFYFEAVPVISETGKHFRLRPQALYVKDFKSKPHILGKNVRDYIVTLTFADPFSDEAFASALFKFGKLTPNTPIMDCEGIDARTYCSADKLGGSQGLFPTRPLSEDLIPELKHRQSIALKIKTAANDLSDTEYSEVAEDRDTKYLDRYCKELEVANSKKLAEHQQWDNNCPSELFHSRRKYLYEQLKTTHVLDYEASKKLWDKYCNKLEKKDGNIVECLKIIVKPETLTSGKFLLSSTIIETREGSKLAQFFATAAEKAAPDIKTTLISKLDPIERKKAKDADSAKTVTEAKTKRDAILSATLANSDAHVKQNLYIMAAAKLAENPKDKNLENNVIMAQMDLLKAQAAANEMARTAGLPIPYALVD